MKPAPFYKSSEWQIARRQALHDANYLCQRCGVSLVGMGRAAHVHHRKPLATTPALRSEPLNLKALCQSCHNAEHGTKQGNISTACDLDGNPVDASHPWFKKDK